MRERLGVTVEGRSLPERYSLVDLKVDLDVENPRDYPYLAYFSDAARMDDPRPPAGVLAIPLSAVTKGQSDYSIDELRDKGRAFHRRRLERRSPGHQCATKIYHRVAQRWRHDRVLLLGDAAHLITPMWALGLNTGILDANSVAWRVAWVLRGWADDASARRL